MIAIIATRASWLEAGLRGVFVTESLAGEGFIHASTPEQVVGSATKHFAGRRDLVLLCIDPARVRAEIRYEGRAGGAQYPHIYGPLNLDAVTAVLDLAADPSGVFSLPEGVA